MEKPNDNNHCEAAVQATTHIPSISRSPKSCQSTKSKQSYIPFLFKNKKQRQPKTSLNPAPGQYETKSNFGVKNQRDILLEKYNILMENTKKIKQSVVFKSSAKRFNYKEEIDPIPISYAYRLSEDGVAKSDDKDRGQSYKFKQIMNKTVTNLKEHPTCPSIPDRTLKFGYSLGKLGQLKKIDKNQSQLEKERQAMIQYVKNLDQERSHQSETSFCNFNKEKSQIMQKMKEKVRSSSIISENNKIISKSSCINIKINKKPKFVQSCKGNLNKIHKILEEKNNVTCSLGPGCYNVNDGTFGKLLKPQKFQFFCSTSERFAFQKEQMIKNNIKKLQTEDKYAQLRKTNSKNFRKGLKKPERTSDKSEMNQKQLPRPGPGDYNPNQRLVKAKIGKVSPFDKSARFETSEKQNSNPQSRKSTALKANRKLSNHMNLPYNNPLQNKHLLKYTEIMQRNKQLLKTKKQQMQESIKKYKTNQQTQYSICSWQSRPFSRNEGLPSVLKDSSHRNCEM